MAKSRTILQKAGKRNTLHAYYKNNTYTHTHTKCNLLKLL